MATIIGSNTADTLNGTVNADTIAGLAGSDQLSGNAGIDHISGGEGADTIDGGEGDDFLFGFGASDGQPGTGDIRATLLSSAFSQPVFAASAPGDPNRLFVIEQYTGQIRILDLTTRQINPTPFLDIPDAEMSLIGEEGLLGLAFHPDYAANGLFFVFITNAAGNLEVRKYQRSGADPDEANPTGDIILQIPHITHTNHNGGWMAFGPDGFLYISVGDGGGGGDALNNAQNKDVLLGKMLRIDVNGDDFPADANRDYRIPASNPFVNQAGADEIWALGLRNPWRPSFDRLTGDLYIADVGQNQREEVNFQPASSAGGENYGWKVKEGFLIYDDTVPGNPPPTSPPLVDPLIDYPHGPSSNSVTGGYVYRGTSPGMQGVYFYADFSTSQLYSFRVVNGIAVDVANRTPQLVAVGGAVNNIAPFAEDGNGNLYAISRNGGVFHLDPQIGAGDGADTINGGDGNDRIYGGAGYDSGLNGNAGEDRVFGGIGDDRIDGGDGNDLWLAGEAGDDFVNGGLGNDRIDGGDGYDNLHGSAGSDRITGGLLNDNIFGGLDNDTWLSGEAGSDFVIGNDGDDRIDGGADGDRLLAGEAGADIITGGSGNDRIDGGADNDRLFGEAGEEIVTAGPGDDYLNGGSGTDRLHGEAGLDTFDFDAGSDYDLVYDFTDNQDTLRIDPAFGFANAAAVVAATGAIGTDAVINLGGGNVVRLLGYLAGSTINSLLDDIVIA